MSQNPPYVPPWFTIQAFPMQPMYVDQDGVVRFVQNRIVAELLDYCTARGYSLNDIARQANNGLFTDAERMQLAQLIGYSVGGWGELSYVSEQAWKLAEEESDKLIHQYK